ncbi:hypothetical protein LOK49_LG02G04024 [Camellia lanceoleosa]|uniref:Uncharacterized protein n=1 Tax=Camellia lanceoleosa TaxID=1840588 RepID=A0ACC0IU54_9ERIC|nr:hypothetical protein LOK49_LG02G04024 [Camellia lanceoleosa]
MRSSWALTLLSLLTILVVLTPRILAEQRGSQAGGALCPGGPCCSQHGWCGTTPDYCTAGCQSQCGNDFGDTLTPGPSGGDIISNVISKSMFNQMLLHRNDAVCPAKNFYTYEAFIAATKSFGSFGTTGDTATRLKEIAAFLAQTSHKTTG